MSPVLFQASASNAQQSRHQLTPCALTQLGESKSGRGSPRLARVCRISVRLSLFELIPWKKRITFQLRIASDNLINKLYIDKHVYFQYKNAETIRVAQPWAIVSVQKASTIGEER